MALSASIALADDFKTVAGKEYKDATVTRVEPDGIVVKHKSGISKLYFVELPKEVQQRFHYDRAKTDEFAGPRQHGNAPAPNELAIPARFAAAESFSEGLAAVQFGDKNALIKRRDASFSAELSAHTGYPEEDSYFPPEQWGFIDTAGRVVIPPKFYSSAKFKNGQCRIRISRYDLSMVTIDKRGNEVAGMTEPSEDSEYTADSTEVGGALKYGFRDRSGGQWIVPARYQMVGPFSGGLAAVQLEGKWGFINKRGEIVVQPVYDAVWDFAEGLAAVKRNDKWAFVDATGTLKTGFDFEEVRGQFSNGLAGVKISGKWGFISPEGTFAVQPRFWDCGEYSDGLAPVAIAEFEWGYIRVASPIATASIGLSQRTNDSEVPDRKPQNQSTPPMATDLQGKSENFTTLDGKEYKNVMVTRVEPDGIMLRTKSGISKVYFTQLPKEVQERFHYDAAKAANLVTAEHTETEKLKPWVADNAVIPPQLNGTLFTPSYAETLDFINRKLQRSGRRMWFGERSRKMIFVNSQADIVLFDPARCDPRVKYATKQEVRRSIHGMPGEPEPQWFDEHLVEHSYIKIEGSAGKDEIQFINALGNPEKTDHFFIHWENNIDSSDLQKLAGAFRHLIEMFGGTPGNF